jgi:hypothetical protein
LHMLIKPRLDGPALAGLDIRPGQSPDKARNLAQLGPAYSVGQSKMTIFLKKKKRLFSFEKPKKEFVKKQPFKILSKLKFSAHSMKTVPINFF